MRDIKFLLVVNDMAWFWSHRLPLAKDILAQGAQLHLATNDAQGNAEINKLGITGHDLPAHTGSFNPFSQMILAWRIFKTLKEIRPDIVHAITLRHAFYTGIASRFAKTPCAVFTVAGLGSLFESEKPQVKIVRMLVVPLLRFAFGGRGRFVIFQNPDDAGLLVRTRAATKENSVVIRGSGVDPLQFPYTPEPQTDEPAILFCSRLLKAKGIGEFVHAARIVRSKGIRARFMVAGDLAAGNHDSVTPEELADWKKEGIVEFLGQRQDIPALMAQASLVALPSYYGEGVPKVLLEAAAIGRAIVTTDMPGCREAVEDGVTGLLVEARNAWDLADAMERLILDPALRQAMGRSGHARIEEGFTVRHVNDQTMGVYKTLLSPNEKAALSQAA